MVVLASLWPTRAPTYSASIRAKLPHDVRAFTQGLALERGSANSPATLLESTGLYGGRSSLRRVERSSGRVLRLEPLLADWFGEGVALLPNACVQLLWRERLILVRDLRSLKLRRSVPLPEQVREGWGVAAQPMAAEPELFVSDGTSRIHVLCGRTFRVLRALTVRANGVALSRINDLEWIEGEIWANVWGQDRLAVICPVSGRVRCFVNLRNLLSRDERRMLCADEKHLRADAVLNGITFDEKKRRVLVTGKCWPHLFEIETDALRSTPTTAKRTRAEAAL